MANVDKFTQRQVAGLLRHIERTTPTHSNTSIDAEKIHLDYSLLDRDIPSYDYYKQRLDQCYVYGREDINTTFSWVITLPPDVPKGKEDLFFHHCFNFLCDRYGGLQNVVQSAVHYSETTPHMHTIMIPAVENKKITATRPQAEKLDCSAVINRKDLRSFHPDLDRYLKSKGMPCGVYTGITAKQGGAKTVRELKAETARERSMEVTRRW